MFAINLRQAYQRGSVTNIKAARTVAQTTKAKWCDFDENKSLMNCSLCYHYLFSLAKQAQGPKLGETRPREKSLKTTGALIPLTIIYRLKTQHYIHHLRLQTQLKQ